MRVPTSNGSRTDTDFGHKPIGITNGNKIADPDRMLEQNDKAANEIGHDLLQSKTDSHAQCRDQPLEVGPSGADATEGE